MLRHPRRKRFPKIRKPPLRFSPTAWAKLLYLRDAGDTEVGGFGISSADDLLLIQDFRLIRQKCTSVSVEFEDGSVADFFDEQIDAGRKPEQFARIWIHTHPGDSATPSFVDEETFGRVFGRSDWAVMFILAQENQSYARLKFNLGPTAEMKIPVTVDYGSKFAATNPEEWDEEYDRCVRAQSHDVLQPMLVDDWIDETDLELDADWYAVNGEPGLLFSEREPTVSNGQEVIHE